MKIRPVVYIVPTIIALLSLIIGSVILWQLFFFLVIVIALSYLWVLINIRGIEVDTANIPESLIAGEWFDEDITITNRSSLPKFNLTVEQTTDIIPQKESLSLSLSPESSQKWKPRIYCRRRGLFNLGLFTIEISDPFGLISLTRQVGTQINLLVYPAAVDIPLFQPENSSGPEYRSAQRLLNRTSATISRVREYAQGDTLNHIHWLSTAHKGSLMVKMFEPEPVMFYTGSIWLILDMHKQAHDGIGANSTEERGITITSSLLNKYLASGKNTGLIVSGNLQDIFTPDNDLKHAQSMKNSLALIKAEGKLPVHDLLNQELSRFDSGSTVIIVTPKADPLLEQNIRTLKNKGCLVVVIFIDSSSFSESENRTDSTKAFHSAGAQVYTVRKDHNINRALDSHRMSQAYISME